MTETVTAAAGPSAPSSKADHFLISGEGMEPVAPGVWILHGQGNSAVFELADGVVIVDSGPGGRVTAGMIDALRKVTELPVLAICFSHGHLGYNSGLPLWLEHARARGEPVPRAIAHANLPKRVQRYRETMPLQEKMAEIQFRRPPGKMDGKLPANLPSETFDDRCVIGDPRASHVELLWAPSETDDALAVWYPSQRILYSGPSVIDSIPNVGTPFRTQRDPVRWAETLDRLALLRPALLIREFGPALVGETEVQHVLRQTSMALRWVREEAVRLMNAGMSERQMLAAIIFPPELFDVPWMKATYGDPAWIARDVFRSENGWWDRNPTSLHPAAPEDASAAILEAITDKRAVLERAAALADQGQTQLALHVVDVLATLTCGGAEVEEARRLKARLMRERASQTQSYISKSVYHSAAQMLDDGQAARFGIV